MAQIDVGKLLGQYGINPNRVAPVNTAARSRQSAKPKQNFLGNVATSAKNIAGTVGKFVLDETIGGVTGMVGQAATNLSLGGRFGIKGAYDRLDDTNTQLLARQNDITTRYQRTGNKQQYNAELKALLADGEMQSQSAKQIADSYAGYGDVAGNALKAGGTIATVAAPFLAPVKVATSVPLVGKAVKGAESALAIGRGNVVGKIARNALVTQPTIGQPGQIADAVGKGDLGRAGVETALMASPLLLGVSAKAFTKYAPKLKEAFIGRAGVLDEAFGNRVVQWAEKNPKRAAELKRIELFTQSQPAVLRGVPAGQFLASYLNDVVKIDPKTAKIETILDAMAPYADEVYRLEKLKQAGKVADNLVISHEPTKAVQAVVKELRVAEKQGLLNSKAQLVAFADDALDRIGVHNQTLRNNIYELLEVGKTVDDIEGVLKSIPMRMAVKVDGFKPKTGFIATYGPKERAVLPTLAEAADAGAPQFGKAAAPVLGKIGSGARKAGVGIEDYNPMSYGLAEKRFIAEMENGKAYLDKLKVLADEDKLTDLRQLRISEIRQGLGVDKATAKMIRSALDKAFVSVPTSIRGLGNKVQDINIKYNPVARQLSRTQGQLRYSRNPFFRAQQRIEAAALGSMQGSAFTSKKVDEVVNQMKAAGLINKSSSWLGEATEGMGGLSRVTNRLTLSEEQSLARTLIALAENKGTTIDDLLRDDKTRQLLRSIVQTPSKGINSSNLAKTLNLAIFPLNYNAKVTALAVKALVNQPVAVQFAVVKQLADLKSFLDSDDGQLWQSENSELLGILKYFTPTNSVMAIWKQLPGQGGTVRDLGAIGGLPFNIIVRLLENVQVIPPTQSPYINPKTGEVMPDKIPTTMMGQLKQAVRDLLDITFTFPGRQAGFGSKQGLIDTATGGLFRLDKSEYEEKDRTGDLTPAQIRRQNLLRSVPQQSAPTEVPKFAPLPAVTAPKIKPIYKAGTGTKKGPKAKTRAVRPGQAF